jgi:hypothetical protein
MDKKDIKVEFRNKKMNLLEARLYLCGLSVGIIKSYLKEEEMEDYLRWEDRNFIKNKRVKELIGEKLDKKLDEKHYLIEKLEGQIKYAKNAKKKVYCEKNGHKELKDSSNISLYNGNLRVHVLCSRCNLMYEREPTKEELEKSKGRSYNPFQG